MVIRGREEVVKLGRQRAKRCKYRYEITLLFLNDKGEAFERIDSLSYSSDVDNAEELLKEAGFLAYIGGHKYVRGAINTYAKNARGMAVKLAQYKFTDLGNHDVPISILD